MAASAPIGLSTREAGPFMLDRRAVEHRDFWLGRLADRAVLTAVPHDFPLRRRGSAGLAEVELDLAACRPALERVTGGGPFLVFTTLVAALRVALYSYTSSSRVPIGSPCRCDDDSPPPAAGAVVLTGRIAATDPFKQVLLREREELLAAYRHQGYPMGRLLADLDLERGDGAFPLFDLAAGSAALHEPMPELGQAMTVWLTGAGGGRIRFDRALYAEATVAGFARRLAETLAACLEDLEAPVASRTPPERAPGVGPAGAGRAHDAPATVVDRVRAHAGDDPDAPAVVGAAGTWSYGRLWRTAADVAAELGRSGAGRGAVVGVLLERGPEAVAAQLATLAAGAAFLPLDPSLPERRLEGMLADSGAGWLITSDRLAPRVAGFSGRRLSVAPPAEAGGDAAPPLAAPTPEPDDLAYLIYTSGSTGRPKAVELTHRGLSGLVAWHRDAFSLGPGDRASLVAGLGFDGSVWEIWSALAAGAALHVPSEPVRSSPTALQRWLLDQRIAVAFVPTPLAAAVLELEWPAEAPVRVLLTGGDRLRRYPPAGLPFELVNNYGPTEATVVATSTPVPPEVDAGRLPPIGAAVAGAVLRVLDGWWRPVPLGGRGELWLGGPGLARGYRGRPGLTAERFRPDPMGEPGARLYRTGDRVRRAQGGELEFLGRGDEQVQVRGHRIEPGEIEAVLAAHPSVREAVVIVDGGEDDPRLVAYAVPAAGALDVTELRGHLGERLPSYMVPGTIVPLAGLPLTSAGKVDRSALPAPTSLETAVGGYVAPRSPVEEVVAGIWSELLGRERVGVHDNFFVLGGHSLLATQVVSRLQAAFGVEVSLPRVFERPTVAELSAEVESLAGDTVVAGLPPLVRTDRRGPVELSFGQQRLWFLDQLDPGRSTYHIPLAARLHGDLQPEAMRRAIGEVSARHESLRTTFRDADGRPQQVIGPPEAPPVPWIDLGALPARSREEELVRVTGGEAERRFDLAAGPLFRARLVRLAAREHAVLFTLHHIVGDGWSMGVFMRELSVLYEAFRHGRPSPLPVLPLQYADFAAWQRSWLQGERLEAQLAYWRDQLAGAPPVLDLPLDRPRGVGRGFRGARRRMFVSAELTRALRELSRRRSATLFMTLLAAFAALLGRLAGQRDVTVGTPIANRNHPGLEGMIGFFVNTLALRVSLRDDPSFDELLARVREIALGAYMHQDLPFEKLVEELQPERNLAHTPLFQVMFVLQNTAAGATTLSGIGHEPLEADSSIALFDLTLSLADSDDGLGGPLLYRTDLFDASTVERMSRQLCAVLAAVAEEPGRRLSSVSLLAARERHQVVTEWNDRPAAPGAPIHRRFEEAARRRPERIAVRGAAGEALSYGQLDRRSARLARRLRALGVGPDTRVAVLVERSPRLVVALLGILRAGGAYVPLDPVYPRERLELLLADSGAAVLVADPGLLARLGEPPCPAIDPAAVAFSACDADDSELSGPGPVAVDPRNLAYLVYTSGSTGRPKAVAIEHRSAAVRLAWASSFFTPDELGAALAATSICFDLSVFEIFAPLAVGGTVTIVEDALALAELPEGADIRLVNTVPSAAAELVRQGALPASVRTVNLAGEALPGTLAEAIHAASPGVRLLNLYGPSEDTTYSTAAAVPSGAAGEPPIGRPLPGTRALVLDESLEPVAPGQRGELYLGGEGLARGYLGRPALTASRFVPSPHPAAAGDRLYRTGDRVRLRSGGTIEYLGRTDHQVKIRGFRVEPGEIEAVLATVPGVREAAVAVHPGPDGAPALAAYAAAEGVTAASLQSHLRRRLPEHMVPGTVSFLPRLPRTAHGKVDRAALPAPGEAPATTAAPPRNLLETVLAEAWSDLLGVSGVGAHDDFFERGGHSLLATQMIARLRATLGVDLALRSLFERPTIAELAELIAAAKGAGDTALQPPPPAPRPDAGPVSRASYAQQRYWILDRLGGPSPAHQTTAAIDARGALDAAALDGALTAVVGRHAALRTVFRRGDGGLPLAVVTEPAPMRTAGVDLRGLDSGRRAREAERVTAAAARLRLDIERGPLLVVWRLDLEPEARRLVFVCHNMIADGWSLQVLFRELGESYSALAAGRRPALPALPLSHADCAEAERRWLELGARAPLVEHWRRRLEGLPPLLDLPLDRPRPARLSYRGASTPPFVLGEEQLAGVEALARSGGATAFMVLLAALEVLLSRWSGEEDFAIGTLVAGRNHTETEGLIGPFTNLVALRSDLRGRTRFRELLAAVRETALEAHAYQALPFPALLEELGIETGRSHWPVFQVLFTYNQLPAAAPPSEGIELEPAPVPVAIERYGLTLLVDRGGRRLSGIVRYSRDLFDPATGERLAQGLLSLLEAAAATPDRPFRELPLLGLAERRHLLAAPRRRGYPLDLDRIGAALAAHPEVARVRLTPQGDRLVAYFDPVPGASPRGDEVLDSLRGRLPHYLIPDACVRAELESAVAEPPPGEAVAAATPVNGLAARLSDLWREVLGVAPSGPADDFFALGGTSLAAVELQRRIDEEWGRALPSDSVFHLRTLGALARRLGMPHSAGEEGR